MKLDLNQSIMGDGFVIDDFDPDNPKTCKCGAIQTANKSSTSGTNGYTKDGLFVCVCCPRQQQIDLFGDVEVGSIWASLHGNFVLKVEGIIPDNKYRWMDKALCLVVENPKFFEDNPEFKKTNRICEYRSCLLDFELYKRVDC